MYINNNRHESKKAIFRDIDEVRRKLNRQRNNLVHTGIIVLPNIRYKFAHTRACKM